MDYNSELNKLKQQEYDLLAKAEKEGYKLINGELTKKSYIPVIEIYARAETDYESYGGFCIFKKTFPLTNKQLNTIKSIEQTPENIIDNLIYGNILNRLEDITLFYEILDIGRELSEENIARIVEDLDDEYHCLKNDQKLYLEFFFNKDNLDGYISIYDLPLDKLQKQDNIQLYLKKYLTWN